jgi:ribosome-associated protein
MAHFKAPLNLSWSIGDFEHRGGKSIKKEIPNQIDSRERSILCASQALIKKAIDTIIIDVSEISSFADYFVICSGKSDRQVRAIAEHIQLVLKEQHILPNHIEGLETGQWVLMDYDDCVVHIFFEPIRTFYDLEGLWSDAKRLEFQEGEGAR